MLSQMKPKKLALINIGCALLFAILIILSSALFPEQYPTSMYILLILWFIPSTIINIIAARNSQ